MQKPNLENCFQLVATLHKVNTVRYTPAGIAVLDVVLQHSSQQQENGTLCQIQFELPAKIIGDSALLWQHQEGQVVHVSGFLAQRNKKSPYPVLRIQNIQHIKVNDNGSSNI